MTLYLKGNNSSEMLIEIHNYIFDISARKTEQEKLFYPR